MLSGKFPTFQISFLLRNTLDYEVMCFETYSIFLNRVLDNFSLETKAFVESHNGQKKNS